MSENSYLFNLMFKFGLSTLELGFRFFTYLGLELVYYKE